MHSCPSMGPKQNILGQSASLGHQETCTLSSIKESFLVCQKWPDLLFSSFFSLFHPMWLWIIVILLPYRKLFCTLKFFKLPLRKSLTQVQLITITKGLLWFILAKLWLSGTWFPVGLSLHLLWDQKSSECVCAWPCSSGALYLIEIGSLTKPADYHFS